MNTLTHIGSLTALLERKQALQVSALRSPRFVQRLAQLRAWQAQRLARTYADLAREPPFRAALEFFLNDLYGVGEFTERDRDLGRCAAHLGRALPAVLLDIACAALELDVLSAELDQDVAAQLRGAPSAGSYAVAYRAAGRRADRQRQIRLIITIGTTLDTAVKHSWVGLALRAAHVPAHLAGYGVLQDFLERGWQAFRALPAAQPLLEAIQARETALMEALFEGLPNPFAAAS